MPFFSIVSSKLLSQALNSLLQFNPQILETLKPFAGKSVEFDCIFSSIHHCMIRLYIFEDRIELKSEDLNANPSLKVRFSVVEFLKYIGRIKPTIILHKISIIEGDIELAETLFEVFQYHDIRLEDILGKFLPNSLVFYLSRGTLSIRRKLLKKNAALKREICALLEDRACTPQASELESFYSEVDALKLRFDRLNAQVQARDF